MIILVRKEILKVDDPFRSFHIGLVRRRSNDNALKFTSQLVSGLQSTGATGIREIAFLHEEPIGGALEVLVADNAMRSLDRFIAFLRAHLAPKLPPLLPLALVVAVRCHEWLLAQVTELVHPLAGVHR